MASASVGGRHTIDTLAAKMSSPECLNDFASCRSVLSKVMTLSANHANLTPLLPSAVKLLAHSDMCIKKMAGHILIQYGANDPEMILLAINTLLKDCQESNPMLRGLALKTLCALQQESILEFADKALKKALSDKSSYVRRAAVIGSVKVFHFCSSYIRDGHIIDQLYSMIRDPDPLVVVNCISALEEILHDEGGIVLNKNIAHHLLNRVKDFPTWSQANILMVLKKYTPSSDDEVFDIMNLVDPFLKHNSCTVVCFCLELFLHIVSPMPHLQSEICRRGKEAIVSHLGSGNIELIYSVVDFLSSLSKMHLQVFCSDYQSFFCRYKEPPYLKMKKMKFLPVLLNQNNEQAILDELSLHCKDGCKEVSKCAVDALATISRSHQHLNQSCLEKFQVLLESSSSQVVSNVLQVLQMVPLKDQDRIKDIILILGSIHRTVKDDSGTIALLHLLGEYGQHAEDVPYILEDFVDRLEEIDNPDLKEQLLNTVIKVFFSRPGETQSILGSLLEACISDSNRALRDRAKFYYSLLETDVVYAKSVICGLDPE
ncbi:AP-4 complex subunit beta-1-like [Haliotis rufescens]|uniref:AP-4 complex subunit beta-1-like n=1 Tax=Haliotis rufescens TaxID=6454 RepID=UPI001EB06177|nr:AP-4 complex subunit beta-1-like [Haliotis rufescens]